MPWSVFLYPTTDLHLSSILDSSSKEYRTVRALVGNNWKYFYQHEQEIKKLSQFLIKHRKNMKFRLQQELFNKQITYLRDKNAKLLIRNQHLERKLHEQANNAGRRSSSRSKTIPTKEKVCKVFRIY